MLTSLFILALASVAVGVPVGVYSGVRAAVREEEELEEGDVDNKLLEANPYRALPVHVEQMPPHELIVIDVIQRLPEGTNYRAHALDKDTVVLEFRARSNVWLTVAVLDRGDRDDQWWASPTTARRCMRAMFDFAMLSAGHEEGTWIKDK